LSTSYPTTKQTFTDPSGTQTLASPDHAGLHTDMNDTVEAIQDTIGTTAGTNVLKDFSAGQFPVRQNAGGTVVGTPTINNAILGTPATTGGTLNTPTISSPVVTLGSDATGDIYYRNSGGSVARLAVGTDNQVLTSNGTLPGWETPSSGFVPAFQQGTTSGPTTSSTNYGSLNEMAITFVSTLGTAMVDLGLSIQNSAASGNANFIALSMDGAGEVAERFTDTGDANTTKDLNTFYMFTGLSAGTHTVVGRWKVGGGTALASGTRRGIKVWYN